jgi:hypothetical protein
MDERFLWAERHDGLMITKRLLDAGRSRRQIVTDRERQRVRTVRRGVVAVNGSPRTWRQEVRAVLLATGPEVAASHDTALRILGIDRSRADGIHVMSPLTRQVTMEGVISHRSGVIEDGDIVTRDFMRVTSGLRCVIDLSGSMSADALGRVVDELIRRRQLDLELLRSRVNRTRPAPGRSVATLRKVLAERIPGYDPGESELEARIARLIDAHGLPRPAQQHRVRFDKQRYRIDFAWPDRRLYLEGNGFGAHRLASDRDHLADDGRRDRHDPAAFPASVNVGALCAPQFTNARAGGG